MDGNEYVTAAYLVFLALVLAYVAIMAARLGRLEREIVELESRTARRAEEPQREAEVVA